MNKELIIMIGLPGSGKSTYVNQHLSNYHIVCADDIRLSLGYVFEPKIEPIVHFICETTIRSFFIRGFPIVVDETNTKIDTIKKWIKMADQYGYRKVAIHVKTPDYECKKRRGCAKGKFPSEVIDRMAINKRLLFTIKYDTLKNMFDEIREVEFKNV